MPDAVDGLAETADAVHVGPYRLIARLGAGGMGEVWRAYDEVLRREVALKVLRAARVGNADARSRMLREARAQAALNHPNICTIYQAGEGETGVWIAMERLAGPTLAELASKGRIEIGRVARWGVQIAQALAAAHAVGLAHRDLKPSNAMLAAGGEVKLLDFGLAKRLENDDAKTASADATVQTEDGRVIGTPRYMSPEQAAGETVGTPSDVFSLGIMLFELVAQKPPFVAPTAVEVMARIIREPAPSLATAAPDAPADLVAIVQACLARESDERPTAVEVAARLGAFADTASTAIPPVPPPRRRRTPLLVVGGAVIAAAIVATVVAVAMRSGDHETKPAPIAIVDAAVPDAAAAPATPALLASGAIHAAAFTPDGRSLVFVADRRAWISTDGGAASVIHTKGEPLWARCCIDGKLGIVSADENWLLDPQTRALEPTQRSMYDNPDGKHRVGYSFREVWIATMDDVRDGAPIATAPEDAVFSGARWSPDGTHLAWIRNMMGVIDIEVMDLATRTVRTIAKLEHASDGPSNGLAWRGGSHLAVIEHRAGDSLLLEIDALVQPTPTPRVLARWPKRTIDLLAINGDKIAVTETGVQVDLVMGTVEAARIVWSKPLALAPPGVWARDGRVIATRFNRRAKTSDLVLASGGGEGVPLVTGAEGHYHYPVATAATGLLYARVSDADQSAELWSADFTGRSPRKVRAFDRYDSVACGDLHCAILERTGTNARLREIDLATGTLGKSLLDIEINIGQTLHIGASPDGERFAVPVRNEVVIVDRKTAKQRRVKVDGTSGILSVDLTADPNVMFVADNHLPAGFSLSRVRGARTEVLATDAMYYELSMNADDTQVLATRLRTPGGVWVETLR